MLKCKRVTTDNYAEEVQHLRNVANAQPEYADMFACKKAATELEKFFKKPIEDYHNPLTERLGISFVDRALLVYTDKEQGDEWQEFMLITEDGTHYELQEVSGHKRTAFPLLTKEELKERCKEAREIYRESTESGDYWESIKEEEDYDLW